MNMVDSTVELIIELIENPAAPPRTVQIPGRLIQRNSTKPIP
jgi:DNA-binding LacI/PurR family transcriptional regulator